MCKRKKKAMSPRHSTYIPSSVKWPFWDLEDDIGLGGGDFIVIIWGQPTMGWDYSYGEVDHSRHHVKILVWQLEES